MPVQTAPADRLPGSADVLTRRASPAKDVGLLVLRHEVAVLSGADLVDTAVQPVDVQLGGPDRLGDGAQVFERLRQPVMPIKDSAAVERSRRLGI
jgi:hypothetical protein